MLQVPNYLYLTNINPNKAQFLQLDKNKKGEL